MTLGVNGLGNTKANNNAAGKLPAAPTETVAAKDDAPNPVGDALALGVQGPVTTANARQLAREFAEKFTRLQAASNDAAAYDLTADAIGTQTYVLVDIVNRLCRDTQSEPLEERIKALNMIQHTLGLPDDIRRAIEEDLERTSSAA